MRYALFYFLIFFTGLAYATNPAEIFDPKLIQYYKVDSCKVYVLEPGDTKPVLQFIYVFNQQGLAIEKLKVPQYEDEDTLVTTYDYVNGLLVREQTLREGRDPLETHYFYKGRVPVRKVVKSYDTKDYEIYADDEGMILGMVGMGMVSEIDSLTGDLTGNMVIGKVDEYEYRYNRFKKMTREIYYYLGQEYYQSEFDYGPNANQPVLQKLTYRMSSKTPDTKVLYTYGGSALPVKEETIDIESQSSVIVSYEYVYNQASPVNQQSPIQKSGPTYSPTKRKR